MKDKIPFDYKTIRILPNDCLTATYLPAVKVLNSIMDEACTPEATATCLILSSYTLQKWAAKARKDIDEFTDKNKVFGTVEGIHQLLVDIYDVPKRINFPEHKKSLQITEEILALVEKAIEGVKLFPNSGMKMYDILEKIHLKPDYTHKDVNSYTLKKWYKQGVELIISRYGDNFSKIFEEIIMKFSERDDEKQLAYHNTVLLLEAYPIFRWNISIEVDVNNLNTSAANSLTNQILVVKLIEAAIKEISNYPDEGQLCADIIDAIVSDKKPEDVWIKNNISRSFYYRARKKSILLLSYMVWGYTTRDVMNLAI